MYCCEVVFGKRIGAGAGAALLVTIVGSVVYAYHDLMFHPLGSAAARGRHTGPLCCVSSREQGNGACRNHIVFQPFPFVLDDSALCLVQTDLSK